MIRVVSLGIISVVLCLLSATTAFGQRDAYQAEDEIKRLLADAGRSYNDLELQQADSSVARALQLVAQFGVQSDEAASLVAQLYVLRGVISYVKDRNTSVAAADFVKALRYDDRARIDQMMSSPSLERIFEQARGQLRTSRDMDRGRRGDSRDFRGRDQRDSRRDDRRNSRRDDRYDDRYRSGRDDRNRGRSGRRDWNDDRGRNNSRDRFSDRRNDDEPMRHRRPRDAQSNRDLRLTVSVSRDLDRDVDRMFVFFRTARSQSTQRLEMRRGRRDEFSTDIPKRYMVGSTISYYFKAEDRSQTEIASLGSPRKPFRVSISGDLIGSDVMPTGSTLDGTSTRTKKRSFFTMALSLGTGFGQVTKFAKPVKQPGARISQPGLALSPFHLLIELDVWVASWLSIGFFERLQLIEFTHLEGGRFKFKVYNSGSHALILRAGGGVGYIRHLVELSAGQLDTTLEGIGSASFGLTYMYSFSDLISLVFTPDYIQLFGESPSYHLDLNIGLGFSF